MNNANEYRSAMDGLQFTDTQKAALTAELTRSTAALRAPAPAHRRPILRTVLIAAAMCIVLAGTAFAVTVLHSAGIITPFSTGDKKEDLGFSNPGYTVTYEAERLPLSDFSDQILADAALPNTGRLGFDSWDAAEAYIGFNLMDNSYLAQAEQINTPYLLEGGARTHATVISNASDGALTSAMADASYCVVENGIPVRIDLTAIIATEKKPADVDISQWNTLFTEEKPDLIFSDITGSNGLSASLVITPNESYPNYYSAYFAANGICFMVNVQYQYQDTTADPETGNAAAEAALQAVIDGFSF